MYAVRKLAIIAIYTRKSCVKCSDSCGMATVLTVCIHVLTGASLAELSAQLGLVCTQHYVQNSAQNWSVKHPNTAFIKLVTRTADRCLWLGWWQQWVVLLGTCRYRAGCRLAYCQRCVDNAGVGQCNLLLCAFDVCGAGTVSGSSNIARVCRGVHGAAAQPR